MAYGPALRLEARNCKNLKSLDSEEAVRAFLISVVEVAGMSLMDIPGNPLIGREEPRDVGKGPGVTGCALLYESHCVIHTYPKPPGWLLLDLVSCKNFDPERVITLLRKWAGVAEVDMSFSCGQIGHLFPDAPA